jgi:hypothetical protein
MMWFWDIGYMNEARNKPKDLKIEPFFTTGTAAARDAS